jgi:hypothetical protein
LSINFWQKLSPNVVFDGEFEYEVSFQLIVTDYQLLLMNMHFIIYIEVGFKKKKYKKLKITRIKIIL